jgi:enterochelin esterase-like enzyme
MRMRVRRLLAGGFFLVLLSVVALISLRCGIKRGTVETVEYDFKKALSGKQRMVVYLPPDYPQGGPYPVLYLLHGAGDDETCWQKRGAADSTLDELYAEKKIVAMIVVMPNSQGRGLFAEDMLEAVIPYVESHYAVHRDGQHRAITGVSTGGWQSLGTGLKHTDRFAWVGGFSPSLATDVLPIAHSDRLKLLWLSCSDRDGLMANCGRMHRTLEEEDVPHIWRVSPGEHEWRVWRNDLREFAPLLFRDKPDDKPHRPSAARASSRPPASQK